MRTNLSSSTPIPTLVGRAHELHALRTELDRAISGQGRVVLVLGEPGIGKTRTVQALSAMAAHNAVLTLWGRCHKGPGAPPFWPWVQMLRAFGEARDIQTLCEALGDDAAIVADIWPDIRGHFPGLQPIELLADAAQARFRLFDSISRFWKRVASTQPLLLILEDLHWADAPSLQLLEFVAGESQGGRMLLVGTARDSDLAADHPLMRTLLELTRGSSLQRLAVCGLAADETAQLIEEVTGLKPSEATAAFVQAKTGGNPLFIAEIARHLAREHLLPGTDTALGLQWRVPDTIRALIGMRLDRLSCDARCVLRSAAVIGMQFSFGALRRVVDDLPSDRILAALDDALATPFISASSEPGRYEFGHALTRDTLYDELPWAERIALHERIASAIEDDHGQSAAPPLAALAHHFNSALPKGSVAKAVDYATRAGQQARAGLAYEEAAIWFRIALNALAQTAPPDADRQCKLLIALGSAQAKSGMPCDALESLTAAADQAKRSGSADDLMRAAIEFEEVAWRLGHSGTDAARLLEAALRLVDEGDHVSRAKLQIALVRALCFAGLAEKARKVQQETLELARRSGDTETLEGASRSAFWLPWEPANLDAQLQTADAAIVLADRIGNAERRLDSAANRLHLLMAVGNFAGFSRDLDRFSQLADELRQPFHQYHAMVMRAAQALFVGRFADAERIGREAEALGRRMPGLNASGGFGMQMFTLAQERGQLPELAPLVGEFVRSKPSDTIWRPALVLVQAELGQLDEARAGLEQLAPQRFRAVPHDSLRLASLIYLAQACALTKDGAHADALYALIAPWAGRNLVAGSMVVCYGPADRYLGMLSAVLKRWDNAALHFEGAIEMSRRQGAIPWLAHSQHDYAAMLIERGQHADERQAQLLLNDALHLANGMGMTKLSDKAKRQGLTLGSRPNEPDYPNGLSRREAEVLRLIAAGKSNQEIASVIFRSPNTVASHVRNILAKLGAANRTEAATLAARHKLL